MQMIRHQTIGIAFNVFTKWTRRQGIDDYGCPFFIVKQGLTIFCTDGNAENLISYRICFLSQANVFSNLGWHILNIFSNVGQPTVAAGLVGTVADPTIQ